MRRIPIKKEHPPVTFMFSKNIPKDDYNTCKIGQLNHSVVKIDVFYVFPGSTRIYFQKSISSKFSGTTVGLSSLLNFKKGSREILT